MFTLDLENAVLGASIGFEDFLTFVSPQHQEHGADLIDGFLISRLGRIFKELEFLTNIQTVFSNTKIAKWIQFGESGPKERSALNVWIISFANIWVNDLGRTLKASPDSVSGREKFLSFAENCFEYIHPNLTLSNPDALRNTYEKLRAQGEFDYLR